MQDELTFFDYGARFYDPVVARWTSIDPMAEEYDEWPPYNYTLNNPTTNIDPNGMWTANAGGLIFGGGGDELNYKKEQIGIAEARGDGPDKPLNGGELKPLLIPAPDAPHVDPFVGVREMYYYLGGRNQNGYTYDKRGNPFYLPTGKTTELIMPDIGIKGGLNAIYKGVKGGLPYIGKSFNVLKRYSKSERLLLKIQPVIGNIKDA